MLAQNKKNKPNTRVKVESIYAEITKKQLKDIEEGRMSFNLPNGVSLSRKEGSRACYFSCDDADAEYLKELLGSLDIPWQEN